LTHLAPLLTAAETKQLTQSWFFIRKAPCWRVRYLPGDSTSKAQTYLHGHLADLKSTRHVHDFTEVIYEPETHAFGGAEAMASAHRLFHLDTRHLLTYLLNLADTETGHGHRRELSIMLCSAMMRAAGLDWYEQGDVWARVADHREPPDQTSSGERSSLEAGLRRLICVNITGLTHEASPLAFASEWFKAFTVAGRELADLAADGRLHRGLRAALAHHIIFTWNRHGLPHATQAVLANTAKTVVFGRDPAAEHQAENGDAL
jgi:thiopeptide-type bacteriocin biosynthesis protein